MQSLDLLHHRELVGMWKTFNQPPINQELKLSTPIVLWPLYNYYITPRPQREGDKPEYWKFSRTQ